jgi:hypothetical protein
LKDSYLEGIPPALKGGTTERTLLPMSLTIPYSDLLEVLPWRLDEYGRYLLSYPFNTIFLLRNSRSHTSWGSGGEIIIVPIYSLAFGVGLRFRSD